MGRLVLINGAPASGKSTLARRYVSDRRLALALEIDVVRGMLGQWLDDPTRAGLAARDLAIAMARTHLVNGYEVVIPQFVARLDFVEALETLCLEVGADFVELALVSSPGDIRGRFARRAGDPQDSTHRDATDLLARTGGLESLTSTYAALQELIERRPQTRVISNFDGPSEAAYRKLLALLAPT